MRRELFAHEQGEGSRTLVLLHGFGQTHEAWKPVIAALQPRCRIMAYDLPGHGRSLGIAGAGVAKAMAAAVRDDLLGRDIVEYDLAGHSMGGAVAMLLALRNPTEIRSLCLLAPGGFGPKINTSLLQRYAAAVRSDELRICLSEMCGDGFEIDSNALRLLVRSRSAPGQSEMLTSIAQAQFKGGVQGVFSRSGTENLHMPVKVVWGKQDRVIPAPQIKWLPGSFACHLFDRAGHMLPAEIPAEIAALLAENMRPADFSACEPDA